MDDLKVKSFELRRHVLDMIMKARTGHIGGDFSVMDILVNLSLIHISEPTRPY